MLSAAAPWWKQQVLAAAAPFIDKANDDWTRAIVSGDADVLSAPYDKDAVFVGPDGTAIRDRGRASTRGRRLAEDPGGVCGRANSSDFDRGSV